MLEAVAEAPPNAFAGGGYWEAMHDSITGYYEVRVDGRDRRHHRLFCLSNATVHGSASAARASS